MEWVLCVHFSALPLCNLVIVIAKLFQIYAAAHGTVFAVNNLVLLAHEIKFSGWSNGI